MTTLRPLKEKRINTRNVTILVVQLGFGILFFAFYFTILQEYRRLNVESDTIAHINGALSLVEHIKNGLKGISEFKETASYSHLIAYPVWHLTVCFVHKIVYLIIPGITIETSANIAAAFVNSLSIVVALGILIKHFVYRINCNYPLAAKIIICLGLIFVGPFDASGTLNNYYLGGYTGNIWHNPTYILVRTIGLIVFFSYTDILSNRGATLKQYIMTSVLLTVSAFCKPNFYQSFLPGLVVVCIVYFLIQRNKKTFLECLKIAGTCVPLVIIALMQYTFALPESGEGRIGVKFLYVWKHFTDNWELSLIVSLIFPVFVYSVMAFKRQWNIQMVLSVSMLVSAVAQYMFFYVAAGPFAGDFSWGIGLAIFFLFVTAAERLAETNITSGKFSRFINIGGWGIFLLHLFFGIIYFYNIWTRLEVTAPLRYWWQ